MGTGVSKTPPQTPTLTISLAHTLTLLSALTKALALAQVLALALYIIGTTFGEPDQFFKVVTLESGGPRLATTSDSL